MNFIRRQCSGMMPALCALVVGLLATTTMGYSADERDVSAALTIRIAKFIGWPERPVIDADQQFFIIGVMGTSDMQTAFGKFSGSIVQDKRVKIVKISPSTDHHDLRRCHIVYAERLNDVALTKEMVLQSKGVLTVAGPGSRESSATCLSIVNKSGKLAFDINLRHTRRSSLGVDAGLIRLARKVTK